MYLDLVSLFIRIEQMIEFIQKCVLIDSSVVGLDVLEVEVNFMFIFKIVVVWFFNFFLYLF